MKMSKYIKRAYIKIKEIQQHYQTCSDSNCPLFNPEDLLMGCRALQDGNCKYQTIHILSGGCNQYLDDKRHGLWRAWHENGQLSMECNFVNGIEHGIYRDWYQDGQLRLEHAYLDGKEHGISREWHYSGQLWYECNYVNGENHGSWQEWRRNGQIRQECNFVNGERHGKYKYWYLDGDLEEWTYVNGKQYKFKRWGKNGQLKKEFSC